MVTTYPYGFDWGPASVERATIIERPNGPYRVLTVRTPFQEFQLYISPTGRSVRIFRGGQELS